MPRYEQILRTDVLTQVEAAIEMVKTRTQTGAKSNPHGGIQRPVRGSKLKVSKGKEKEMLETMSEEEEELESGGPVQNPPGGEMLMEEPVMTPPGEEWAPTRYRGRELTPVSDAELRRKLKEPNFTGDGYEVSKQRSLGDELKLANSSRSSNSKIQRADRLISQWVIIRAEHEANLPGALPHIDKQLQKAREARAALGDTEENHRVGDEAKRQQVVRDRVSVLEQALANSKFEPERENIRGAIEEYRSGRLGYVQHYTLFWAGKPVDIAETYTDFAKDRGDRLDRYAQEYGPHWLWFENPLCSHPEAKPRSSPCGILKRDLTWNSLGHFWVTQGFWKREGWVHRVMPVEAREIPLELREGMPSAIQTRDDGALYAGETGPRLSFRSLLDSGATHPTLFEEDFQHLGIDTARYAAQSIVTVETTNGTVSSKVYELFVEVLTESGLTLADTFLNYHLPMYIGSPCPVFLIPDCPGPVVDENGIEEPPRLSGILPFIAPYITSVPGRNALLMGETRNDVLGAPKFPPERRWSLVHPQEPLGDTSGWNRFDDPLIRFTHNNGLVVDKDIRPGLSELRVNVGQPDERVLVRSNVEMKWHDVNPQPENTPMQPWQPPRPGQPSQPWCPPDRGGPTHPNPPTSDSERLGDDIIAEMDHPAEQAHHQFIDNSLNLLEDAPFIRSSINTESTSASVLTEETLTTDSEQSEINSSEEMFSRRRNARDNPAPPASAGPPLSQGTASAVSPVSQISPPRAIGSPPAFSLISLEEAQRRQSGHMRQHSSTPDLRGSYSTSDGEIPPVPKLQWDDYPLSPTSQVVDQPLSPRKDSGATSRFVPRQGLEDSVESTPTKGEHHRGRSAARAVASIAGGLRQMNPFRRGASRSNRLDSVESTPQKGSEVIPLPPGDDLQTPSRTRRSGRVGVLPATETAVLPSSSGPLQTPSGTSESIATDPPSIPYGITASGASPETESQRFEMRQQPRATLHPNLSAAGSSPPNSSQNSQFPSLGDQGRSAHVADPPSIPYNSTASKGSIATIERSTKDDASELQQMASRPAVRTDIISSPTHPGRHAPSPVLNDILQSSLVAHPLITPDGVSLTTGIQPGGGRPGPSTIRPRHGVTFSPLREGLIAEAAVPSHTVSEISIPMSQMRRGRERLGTSSSYIPPKRSSREDNTLLQPSEHPIPVEGASDAQKTDDGELRENSLQPKYMGSREGQQDITNNGEVDTSQSKYNTTHAPGLGFQTNPLTLVKGNRDNEDPRSPTSSQFPMARMMEIQKTSTGRNEDNWLRPASTAPNFFPPSRKPLPSIPTESRGEDPPTPQKASTPAKGVSTKPSKSGSESRESPNFSRPKPLDSYLGSAGSLNFNPSPYGALPRPSAQTEAASNPNDPFMVGIGLGDKSVEGVVVIDTKPDKELFTETKNNRGPSFEKVLAVTEKLRRGQYDNSGTKLESVKKLTVKGLWNGVGFSRNDVEYGVEQVSEAQRKEERQAVELIAAVLEMMGHLQEFEWKSELPFTKALWPAMSAATITHVFIDLFKAGVGGGGEENDAFPPEDLVPLRTLTALQSLTLVGMIDSYQKQIWEALWLIPSMKHLDLRMITEPSLRRDRDEKWEFIKGSWKIRRFDEVQLTYHGDRGSGRVHFNSGYGEYLDIMCMMKAWRSVAGPDQPQPRMGLESLTLEGFIVDAQPFVKIFDERKFKKLEFVGLNMDAGLALKPAMMIGMKMIVPDENKQPQVRQMATFYPAGSAKLITIKGGKKKLDNK
ncbi:hypothetical protein FGG08_002544 [Glutinoglossum americanum]|uniref:Uncharacterized protein n=1 Tax=Glutinoglossum americanum TaxID=1670608 RepID=A0A9P8L5H9_9PEZI|nr:hypothetical protein FGG08_002544 [Glutinoglossum americanum]